MPLPDRPLPSPAEPRRSSPLLPGPSHRCRRVPVPSRFSSFSVLPPWLLLRRRTGPYGKTEPLWSPSGWEASPGGGPPAPRRFLKGENRHRHRRGASGCGVPLPGRGRGVCVLGGGGDSRPLSCRRRGPGGGGGVWPTRGGAPPFPRRPGHGAPRGAGEPGPAVRGGGVCATRRFVHVSENCFKRAGRHRVSARESEKAGKEETSLCWPASGKGLWTGEVRWPRVGRQR